MCLVCETAAHVIFVIIRWLLLVEYSFKYSESIEYLAAHTSLQCVRCCVKDDISHLSILESYTL